MRRPQRTLLFFCIAVTAAGLSCVALFYPDFNKNANPEWFTAEGVIEPKLINAQIAEEDIEIYKAEALRHTVNRIDGRFISFTVFRIYQGYDKQMNYREAKRMVNLSILNDATLKISVTSHDAEFALAMLNTLIECINDGGLGGPYFAYEVLDKPTLERHPTISGYLGTEKGEELVISVFVLIWYGVLGFILYQEQRHENI